MLLLLLLSLTFSFLVLLWGHKHCWGGGLSRTELQLT